MPVSQLCCPQCTSVITCSTSEYYKRATQVCACTPDIIHVFIHMLLMYVQPPYLKLFCSALRLEIKAPEPMASVIEKLHTAQTLARQTAQLTTPLYKGSRAAKAAAADKTLSSFTVG